MDYQELFTQAMINRDKGNPQLAIEQLTEILVERPDFAAAWNERASLLQKLGFPFDSVMNYERAVNLNKAEAAYVSNMGTAYMDLAKWQKSIDLFDEAIALKPDFSEPWNNKGNTFMRLGYIEKAHDAYQEAVKIQPSNVDARLGLSFSALKLGHYKEGWKEFEWRWKHESMQPRGLTYPEWEGEQAKSTDDGLLIYGEQGLGDVLQFMRYASVIKNSGAWNGKVYVEVRQPINRLAKTMRHIDGVISFGEKPPANIVTCVPMMSLPRILNVFGGVPIGGCPYVTADPYRVGIWREKLKALPKGLLVGVCWAGMSRDTNPAAREIDKRRSMKLSQFGPLTCIPGISWVSLQHGPPGSEIKTHPPGMTIGDWTVEMYDFYDTAAMIECLDLVITVDTSVAHVAGALDKPVWMLSRFDGCWRWLHNKEDTLWYPSMKIYNQKEPGDWAEVVERMAADLSRMVLANLRGKLALVS